MVCIRLEPRNRAPPSHWPEKHSGQHSGCPLLVIFREKRSSENEEEVKNYKALDLPNLLTITNLGTTTSVDPLSSLVLSHANTLRRESALMHDPNPCMDLTAHAGRVNQVKPESGRADGYDANEMGLGRSLGLTYANRAKCERGSSQDPVWSRIRAARRA
uniref:Uncharacterized protein n=1 Tax=Cucumis melo TaxID=3656 RepID=A0A9I9EFY2_CUCME